MKSDCRPNFSIVPIEFCSDISGFPFDEMKSTIEALCSKRAIDSSAEACRRTEEKVIAVCRTDFRNGVKKALYKTAG
jgi:hypothetical protein